MPHELHNRMAQRRIPVDTIQEWLSGKKICIDNPLPADALVTEVGYDRDRRYLYVSYAQKDLEELQPGALLPLDATYFRDFTHEPTT